MSPQMTKKKIFNDQAKVGVIIIPGLQGQVMKLPIYDKLCSQLKDCNVVRLNAWKDANEISKLTLQDIFSALDSAVEELESKGTDKIFVIGRSFGGGMALARASDRVHRYVLWAPAIGIGAESNIAQVSMKPLSNIKSFSDIVISSKDIPNTEMLIIHAKNDPIVSPHNSKSITSHGKSATLKLFPAGGHSFDKHEERLIAETVRFLKRK